MNRSKVRVAVLLLSLALPSLVIAGCSSSTLETSVSAAKVLEAVPKVDAAKGNPCWQQKQIAAQRSYLDTAAAGKDVIYAAPCSVAPKAS